MNKIEVALGIIVFLLSAISLLLIFTGVVPASGYPGRYDFTYLAHRSWKLLPMLIVVGFVAFGHGVYRRSLREACLGIGVIVAAWFASGLVAMNLYQVYVGYIREFPRPLVEMCLSIVPSVLLGIALALDGVSSKQKTQAQPSKI